MMVSEAGREARSGLTEERIREGRAGVSVEVDKPFERRATEDLPLVGGWLAGKLFGTAKNDAPDDLPGTGQRQDGAGPGREEPAR